MKYFLTVFVVIVFVGIYVVLYMVNDKIRIDCDKDDCEGCKFIDCIHHKEEDK